MDIQTNEEVQTYGCIHCWPHYVLFNHVFELSRHYVKEHKIRKEEAKLLATHCCFTFIKNKDGYWRAK